MRLPCLAGIASVALLATQAAAQLPPFTPNSVLQTNQLNAIVNQLNANTAAVGSMPMPPPLPPPPQTLTVDCTAGDTITGTFPQARPGDTLLIIGQCLETVLIPPLPGLTLDGQGTASIDGGGSKMDVLRVEGTRGVHIRGLTVRNGFTGIRVVNGATVMLQDVIIRDNIVDVNGGGGEGLLLEYNAVASLMNSTISNNARTGLSIRANSSANVRDTSISNNGIDGIDVNGGSHLTLQNASVSGNGQTGMRLFASSAHLEVVQIDNHINDEGIELEANATLEGEQLLVTNNRNGMELEDGSSLHLRTSTITGNAQADILAFFSARLSLDGGNAIGSVSCDVSVLSHDDDTGLAIPNCPPPPMPPP